MKSWQLGMLFLLAVPVCVRQSGTAPPALAGPPVAQKQDTIPPSYSLFLLLRASPALDPLQQSIITADPMILDSLLNLYPHLRRVLLRELMTAPPRSNWLSNAQDSLSHQLFRYSQMSEFNRMSLVAKRQNELFGNQVELRNRFYQTDVLKLLRWINTHLK